MQNYRKITNISFSTDTTYRIEKNDVKTPIRYDTDTIGIAGISRYIDPSLHSTSVQLQTLGQFLAQ